MNDDQVLFVPSSGPPVTTGGLSRALRRVGADRCDVLFVHSGLRFGRPNLALGRNGLLCAVWMAIAELEVRTVCMPTFTFSFPNGNDYDRERTSTPMGSLNEWFRRLPDVVRSLDPIMSVAARGRDTHLVESVGKHSCGPESTYDQLHRRGGGVVFLFLGVPCHECFTYSHFVESSVGVPFRYHRPFSGRITADGRTWEDTYLHYARYNGVLPVSDDRLERDLRRSGHLHETYIGDGIVSAIDEVAAFEMLSEQLMRDPFYLAARVYEPAELQDTRFAERSIVAL